MRKGGDLMLIKRISDIIISMVLIIVTFPFMVLITLLIKLDSFGPAIFKQMRVGMNRRKSNDNSHAPEIMDLACERRKYDLGGRPFIMYKFRSMVIDNYTTLLEYRLGKDYYIHSYQSPL